MMTIFHLLGYICLLNGLVVGSGVGQQIWIVSFGHHFALLGNIIGAILGGYVGYHIGWLPFTISDWLEMRTLGRKSTEQLWLAFDAEKTSVRDILRALKRRGEPITAGLDRVLTQMDAQSRDRRIWGHSTFLSVFQEWEGQMLGYDINMPEAERHALLAQFRASLPDSMSVGGKPY